MADSDPIVQKISVEVTGADKAAEAYKSVAAAADATAGSLDKAGSALNTAGGKIGDIAGKIGGFGESWKGLSEAVGTVGESVQKAGGAFETFGPAITAGADSFTKLVQGGTSVVSTLKDVVKGMDEAQAKAAGLKVGEAFTAAGTALETLGGKITAVGQQLEQFGTVGETAGKALEGLGGAVTTAGGFLKDAAKPVSEFVVTLALMPKAIESVTAAFALLRTGAAEVAVALGLVESAMLLPLAAIALFVPAVLGAAKGITALVNAAFGLKPFDLSANLKQIDDLNKKFDELTKERNAIIAIDGDTTEIDKKLADVQQKIIETSRNIDPLKLPTPDVSQTKVIEDRIAAVKADLKAANEVLILQLTVGDVKGADESRAKIEELQKLLKSLENPVAVTITAPAPDTSAAKQSLDDIGKQVIELSARIEENKKLGIDTADDEAKLSALYDKAGELRDQVQQPFTVTIQADDQKVTALKTQITELQTKISEEKKLGYDDKDAKQKLADLTKQLVDLSKPATVTVTADTSEASKAFAELSKLSEQRDYQIKIGGDVTDLDAKIAEAQKKLNDLLRPPPPVAVPAPDTSSFLDKIEGVAGAVTAALGKAFDMSAHADEFDQSLNQLVPVAEKTGEQINEALKIKPLEDPSGAGVFSDLVQAAEKAANEIEAVFQNIKPEFSGSLDFGSVVDAARSAANEIEAAFQNIRPEFTGSIDFNAIISAAQNAAQQVAAAFSTIIIPPPAAPNFSGVIAAASAAAQQIAAIFEGVLSQISTAGQQITDAVSQANASLQVAQTAATDAATAASNAAKSASDAAQSAAAAAQSAANAAQSASSASSSAGGNAWGGLITGPGTGTSDSIFAKLSNGEFVIQAAAVAHYGTGIFEALNRFRLPRFDGLRLPDFAGLRLPRFTLPAFAGGGIVEGGRASTSSQSLRPFVLNVGGQSISGMFANESAVKQLHRESLAQQVSSTGAKPRWVR